MQKRFDLRRYAILSVATLVAALTLTIVAKASQTVSIPNAAVYSYNLAAGANSAPITPAANQSVFIMGTQTALGYRGVGMASLLHVPASFIEWVGLESPAKGTITQGFSSSAGTHILYLDYSSQVDVQVASPDAILIHNGSGGTRTGDLKLIW